MALIKAIEKMAISLSDNERPTYDTLISTWLSDRPDIAVEDYEDKVRSSTHKHLFFLLLGGISLKQSSYSLADSFFKKAMASGVQPQLIKLSLLVNITETLVNAYVIQNNDIEAERCLNIKHSLLRNKSDINNKEHLLRAKLGLGLFPQCADEVEKTFSQILSAIVQDPSYKAELTVLHSEIELIKHEFLLSQQKSQFFSLNKSPDSSFDYSDTERFTEELKKVSPSQLGQDLWVLSQMQFKRDGFFIEFGATDGIVLSNTYLLEKYFGWKGLCAEPNPTFFERLKVNRKCLTSNRCIAERSGDEVEFIFADEYGGIADYADHDSHSQKREAYETLSGTTRLTTISLEDFLLEHNAPSTIEYLSIDTEGSEFDILKSFPFDRWDIRLITVEHNFTDNREKLFDLLTRYGYKRQEAQFDDWYYKE